jgi:tetratricopeptide (TPR) repeat protein
VEVQHVTVHKSTISSMPRGCGRTTIFKALTGIALASFALSPAARGQAVRAPGKDAKHLLVVPALVSSDKTLGYQAAVELRTRIEDDADTKQLWVIPQQNIDETLTASGFPPHEPISPADAKQLATQLRGDMYLDGTASHTPTGVRLDTRLVLTRDNSFVQPLPPAEAPKPSAAAKQVSRDLQAALKQLPGEQKCYDAARAGRYPEALAAAREAIAAYPPSTLARLCIANVYVAMKQPPDSILKVTTEILAQDPKNRTALSLAAQAAYDKKDLDAATKYWGAELAADPANTGLVDDVVSKIVNAGHPEAAMPIIDTAVAQNPNDAKLLGLKYKLLIRSQRWKEAIPVGEQVAKADTSFADTSFFQRQATAYMADSQPQKAAEIAAKGLAKFPNNSTLEMMDAQALAAAGQTQQAAVELRKFLATNPKQLDAWHLLFNAYSSANQADSALEALRQAAANGDSASVVARYALVEGNKYFKRGSANKDRDTLQVAIRYLSFADSLTPRPEAKFLLGAAQFLVGTTDAQQAPKDKNCQLAREAQQYWTQARTNLHDGASVSPPAAAQYLQYLNQYLPAVDRQVKQFCK